MRIVIVGAGLGGLSLGCALSASGHDTQIYERDQSEEQRSQGLYIGLKPDGAMAVLRQIGLLEAATSRSSRSTVLGFFEASGKELFALRLPEKYAMLGISRSDLRRLLLERCPVPVHFGHAFEHYEESATGVRVFFDRGVKVDCDLLVGGDGVMSRVRAQRVGDGTVSLGLTSVRGLLPMGAAPQHALLADGGFLSAGNRATLFAQKYAGEERVLWSYAEPESGGLARCSDPHEALSYVRRAVAEWHEPIPALLEATTPADASAPYTLYDRELLVPSKGGRVVLLGDAAQPMSPFQGEGGNAAMVGALDLATRLQNSASADVSALVSAFEVANLARVERPWRSSRRAASDYHAPDAPTRILQWRHGPVV